MPPRPILSTLLLSLESLLRRKDTLTVGGILLGCCWTGCAKVDLYFGASNYIDYSRYIIKEW